MFCAIELPALVRNLVQRHSARLQEAVPRARASWAPAANLHLTLKFLGEIPSASVADLSKAVSLAVSEVAPFSIRLNSSGVFPNYRQPRVLWLGINDLSGRLLELHARLETEAAKLGFAREARRFHPHLTIARLRHPDNARALSAIHQQLEFEPLDIAVKELLVIRSELSSEGSKYTIVSRHPLK
ncbi:MAG TPA: RNA 2',3'-cyclic phosphodiesterase [Pyrinomonadaceae bacterium]|jgi:2'-5' RNA ligase|nr:RNA 2',3'-cyclic phosphodiesterase [Pyrinomonadaceae bacterium]